MQLPKDFVMGAAAFNAFAKMQRIFGIVAWVDLNHDAQMRWVTIARAVADIQKTYSEKHGSSTREERKRPAPKVLALKPPARPANFKQQPQEVKRAYWREYNVYERARRKARDAKSNHAMA